jgi:hypothetical protein
MPIEWKVIKPKKLIRGQSLGFHYEVKHHRGNGWMGRRFRNQWSMENPNLTHTVGPFKSKFDCMKCMETIDALVTPPPNDAYKQFREYQKILNLGAMYRSGVTTFLKGAKK